MTSKDVLTPQDVVTGFWQCMDRNDFMSVCDWLSDDFECVWPQSGEVITGAWNYAMINIHYPSFAPWRFQVERMLVDGDQVVTDVLISDGIQQARAVTFSTVAAGRIVRQIEYQPESFVAPKWRRQWAKLQPDNPEPMLALERRTTLSETEF